MRILTLDIETAPGLGHVWGLWNQNVSLSQLLSSSYTMSFAAKWLDEKKIIFKSTFHNGTEDMLVSAHELMSEADAIVHWNGDRFDIPTLNKEFWLAGLNEPAPFKNIDLMRVAKRRFRFMSYKLDHIAQELGLGGKVKHSGHEMWIRCMLNEAAAWKKMRQYNIGDVKLTEDVYLRMLPWINNHPHQGLYSGEPDVCRCGSRELVKEGFAYTASGKFQRYTCKPHGHWTRGNRRLGGVDTVGIRS